MPDLIAQGPRPQQRWRRKLPAERKLVLGRAAGRWDVPWDDRISQRHVELDWRQDRLRVQRLPTTRNPVFFGGQEQESFSLVPGEHFVIGETTFTLADERVDVSLDAPRPVTEQTFRREDLKRARFRNADQRIEVLGRLPEMITGAASDEEMFVRLINLLLTGIPSASLAAIVSVQPRATEDPPVEVLHWDRRQITGEDFRPSERLIREALASRESIIHVWSGNGQQAQAAFTLSENIDWAYATPVEGEACRGWAIYVAGRFTSDTPSDTRPAHWRDLQDDLKFTELAASTLSSLHQVRMLQRRHAGLSQFFSPVVLEALADEDPDMTLAPRKAEVSVMFCDLRGFARQAEQSSDDLMELLNRTSEALGVMTRQILDSGGVVGDFHGDSAMGFWGWPLSQQDIVQRAARAALGVRQQFAAAAQQSGLPLAGFQVGIGIATGEAVAGKIGTEDQVKVTVFGPVVNLASRLEGITKLLQAPILLDQHTAEVIRHAVPRQLMRVRRVAVVRPYGLDAPLEVSELLPPESGYPQLTDQHLTAYEAALDALLARDWQRAFELLHQVPAEDRVQDFLTVYIAQHNRTPPDDWDGVIPLSSK